MLTSEMRAGLDVEGTASFSVYMYLCGRSGENATTYYSANNDECLLSGRVNIHLHETAYDNVIHLKQLRRL